MKELQERVKMLLSKDKLSKNEMIQLLDDLYWADWSEFNEIYSNKIEELFKYLESGNLSKEEIAKVLSLYNNLEGIYTIEFANIIKEIYVKDRIKFLKSLNLNKEEAINLVYIFKVYEVFEDGDDEFNEIKKLGKLNSEELGAANTFYSMFRAICDT